MPAIAADLGAVGVSATTVLLVVLVVSTAASRWPQRLRPTSSARMPSASSSHASQLTFFFSMWMWVGGAPVVRLPSFSAMNLSCLTYVEAAERTTRA